MRHSNRGVRVDHFNYFRQLEAFVWHELKYNSWIIATVHKDVPKLIYWHAISNKILGWTVYILYKGKWQSRGNQEKERERYTGYLSFRSPYRARPCPFCVPPGAQPLSKVGGTCPPCPMMSAPMLNTCQPILHHTAQLLNFRRLM